VENTLPPEIFHMELLKGMLKFAGSPPRYPILESIGYLGQKKAAIGG